MKNNQTDDTDISFALGAAFHDLPGYLYWKNTSFIYLGANKNCLDLLGLKSGKDILGKTDSDLLWGASNLSLIDQLSQDDRTVIEQGKVVLSTEPLLISRGEKEQVIIKTEKRPLKNQAGKTVGILGIILEVIDKKQANFEATDDVYEVLEKTVSEMTGQKFTHRLSAQAYMDEIRNCLESVLSQLPCYVYWKDRDFRYIFCNEMTLNATGFKSMQEIVGKTDYDFHWDPKLVDGYREIDEKIIKTGLPELGFEEVVFDKEKRPLYLLVNKRPLHNRNGDVIGIVGVSVDITAQKEMERLKREEEFAEKEDIYRVLESTVNTMTGQQFTKRLSAQEYMDEVWNCLESVLSQLPCYVYWKDRNFRYIFCNEISENITGLKSTEIIGKTDYDFHWNPELVGQYRKVDEEIIKTGLPKLGFEETVFDKDGKTVNLLVNKMPLHNKKGEVVGIIGVSVDITAQKENEHLMLQNQTLQEKVDTTRLFAASIAHELRTPWTGVLIVNGTLSKVMPLFVESYHLALAAGLLDKNVPPLRENVIEGAVEATELIHKAAYAAQIFIDMMLMKVNLDQPTNMDAKTLSIVECVDEALDLYPLTEDEKKLIHWDSSKNKPLDFTLYGDQTLFNHLIFNLLKNALHYLKNTAESGISIWLSRENGARLLHFKDTGAGMNEEVLANLFTAFFSRTRHGTGVGLALCKKIMLDWGGSIECESVQDQYTHFIMSFPDLSQKK